MEIWFGNWRVVILSTRGNMISVRTLVRVWKAGSGGQGVANDDFDKGLESKGILARLSKLWTSGCGS